MVCAKTQKGQVSGAERRGSNILNKGTTKERWEKGGRASGWGCQCQPKWDGSTSEHLLPEPPASEGCPALTLLLSFPRSDHWHFGLSLGRDVLGAG